MEDIILTVKVSKTRLWFGIFFLLVALFHFALSVYLYVTLLEEGLHMLFAFFGILGVVVGISLLWYYFWEQTVFYADGRIEHRDLLGKKRTVHKSKIRKIRISTDESFRKWMSLVGKNEKELLRIPGNMQGYEDVYPLVQEYHVPIEYWRYWHGLVREKRTWENKQ